MIADPQKLARGALFSFRNTHFWDWRQAAVTAGLVTSLPDLIGGRPLVFAVGKRPALITDANGRRGVFVAGGTTTGATVGNVDTAYAYNHMCLLIKSTALAGQTGLALELSASSDAVNHTWTLATGVAVDRGLHVAEQHNGVYHTGRSAANEAQNVVCLFVQVSKVAAVGTEILYWLNGTAGVWAAILNNGSTGNFVSDRLFVGSRNESAAVPFRGELGNIWLHGSAAAMTATERDAIMHDMRLWAGVP